MKSRTTLLLANHLQRVCEKKPLDSSCKARVTFDWQQQAIQKRQKDTRFP